MVKHKHGEEENGYRWIECPRCGGQGRFNCWREIADGICFRCEGRGGEWMLIADIEAAERREAKREAKRQAAEAKREAKAAAKAAAKLSETLAVHPDWQTILNTAAGLVDDHTAATLSHPDLPAASHSDLVKLANLATKLAEKGTLTEKQGAFALRLATPQPCPRCGAMDHAERDCPERARVTAGRQAIEGRIVSRKWQENRFGGSLKCLVVCDDGRKLWGAFPTFKVKLDDGEVDYLQADHGARVSFHAAIEPSHNDPHFGYYKRPTRGALLEQGARQWEDWDE